MYEIHVTLLTCPTNIMVGWKHTKIVGDPDLGGGERHYLTYHTRRATDAFLLIEHTRNMYPDAIRFKIEKIIYDSLEEK